MTVTKDVRKNSIRDGMRWIVWEGVEKREGEKNTSTFTL